MYSDITLKTIAYAHANQCVAAKFMLFASTIISSSCLKSMFVTVYAWSFLCRLKIVVYFTLAVFADGLFVEKVAKFVECLTSVRDSVLYFVVHLGICLGEPSRLEYGIPTKLVWTSGLYNTTLKRENGMRERDLYQIILQIH